MRHHLVAPFMLIVFASALSGCGDDSSTAAPAQPGTIDVTLADHTVTTSVSTVKAGPVVFDIRNDSTSTVHEFVVVKTDLDPSELPVDSDGRVDEKGKGLTFVDEREDIKPGAQTTLPLNLDAGKYVLLCNLDDHYTRKMYSTLTVSGTAPTNAPGTTAASDYKIVDSATVSAGLNELKSSLNDPASITKATIDGAYKRWATFEGTVRKNDTDTYLDMEDGLAKIRRGVLDDDQQKVADGVALFVTASDKYLASNP